MKKYLSFLIICSFFTIACETEVPEVDSKPPTYSFVIEGDDFKHEFTEKDDPSTYQVNLKFNIPYKFYFSSFDEGGIVNSEIVIQTETFLKLNIANDALSQQWKTNNRSFLKRELDWFHQSGVPVNASFIQGKMTFLSNRNKSYRENRNFYFRINDFGGSNYQFNETFNAIPLYISDVDKSEVVFY